MYLIFLGSMGTMLQCRHKMEYGTILIMHLARARTHTHKCDTCCSQPLITDTNISIFRVLLLVTQFLSIVIFLSPYGQLSG
jgi:hypothetical protein